MVVMSGLVESLSIKSREGQTSFCDFLNFLLPKSLNQDGSDTKRSSHQCYCYLSLATSLLARLAGTLSKSGGEQRPDG